jgi:hypothetical protein
MHRHWRDYVPYFWGLVLGICLIWVQDWWRNSDQITKIDCSVEKGWLITDAYYFTNNSKPLTEVHLTITLTGDSGVPGTLEKYWANWGVGEQKSAETSVNSQWHRIEKVEIAGRCDQGKIAHVWVQGSAS